MRTRLMIATATAAALMAGAALAQSAPAGVNGSNFSQNQQPAGDTAVNPPAANQQLPAGVATGNAATNQSASGQAGSGDVTAPSGSANGAIGSSNLNSSSSSSDAASVAPAAGAPTQRASTASAGTDVISNGPVPDTRENRAKYGQPMSRAGKMTKPAGN